MRPVGTGVFRRGPVHMLFGVCVCTRSRQWGSYFDAGASAGESLVGVAATMQYRPLRQRVRHPLLRRVWRGRRGSRRRCPRRGTCEVRPNNLSISAWQEVPGAAQLRGPLSLYSASQIPMRSGLARVGGVIEFAANEDGRRPAWHAVRPGTQRQGAYHAATEHRPSTRTESRSSRGHNACRRSGSR